MNESERSQCFQHMGFWEEDIAEITLSCGICKDVIPASVCNQKEAKVTSRIFKQKLELLCPKCDSVLIGGII